MTFTGTINMYTEIANNTVFDLWMKIMLIEMSETCQAAFAVYNCPHRIPRNTYRDMRNIYYLQPVFLLKIDNIVNEGSKQFTHVYVYC
jgi:hypothetical protein